MAANFAWLKTHAPLVVRWIVIAVLISASWPLWDCLSHVISRDPAVILPTTMVGARTSSENSAAETSTAKAPPDRVQAVPSNQTISAEQSQVAAIVGGRVWVYGLQIAASIVSVGLLLWTLVALTRSDF